jgi:hypothetical protein
MTKATKAHDMNFIHKLFVFFLIFFFILSPRLDFNVVVHAGILSVALLAILVSVRQRNLFPLSKLLVVVAVFFLFLGVYHSFVATYYGNDASYFSSICISVIVSVVFGWLTAAYLVSHGTHTCDLLDQLLVMCVIAAVVNSSVILVEYALPEIKSIIESHLLQNSEGLIYAEHPFELRGLASAGGAGLSVFNAIAVLAIIYLVNSKKIHVSFALLGAVVITCSNIFTGRTGLILSLLFTLVLLLTILVQNLKSGFMGSLRTVSVAIFGLFLLSLLANYDLNPAVAGWAFEWVDGLASGKLESASTDDLATMIYLPGNPIHLLLGVGFFDGARQLYPRSDSGYIKTILSIGVPLSIALYSVILLMFFQVNKVASKYFWLVVSVSCVMMFVEIKEPFLYQNFVARMIFLLSGAAMFILAKRSSLAKADSAAH